MKTFKNPNFYVASLHAMLSGYGFGMMYFFGFEIFILILSCVMLLLAVRYLFEEDFGEPSVYQDMKDDIKSIKGRS